MPSSLMQTPYICTCTKGRGFNDPREMIFNIVPARRAEVDLKVCGVCRATFDHDATSDEGRDRWTFYIITVGGMTHINLESLHFATLNLVEKSEVLAIRTSSK